MNKNKRVVWIARALIAVVTFLNLQAALLFLLSPAQFAPGFELSGVPGEAVIRGMGLLFVMWNIPYLFALVDPLRHRISLIEALIMQFIGVAGESILLLMLPGTHAALEATVIRFIIFDGSGFLALLAAFLITHNLNRTGMSKAES